MAVYVTASVGKNGRNQFQDVMNMQNMLNGFIIQGHLNPITMMVADGMVGKKTIKAIKTFQNLYLGLRNPDGRIDPGGKTLDALNSGVKAPTFRGGGGGVSGGGATREWAIALRSIKNGSAEFSLLNRATAEIKKLVVRNSAIGAIAVNKSFRESWVTFKTFLETNFDNIHGSQASFSKPSQLNYMLGFAAFGSIPVLPFPNLMGPPPSGPVPIPYPIVGTTSPARCDSLMGCQLGLGTTHWGSASVVPILPYADPKFQMNPMSGLAVVPSQTKVLLLAP